MYYLVCRSVALRKFLMKRILHQRVQRIRSLINLVLEKPVLFSRLLLESPIKLFWKVNCLVNIATCSYNPTFIDVNFLTKSVSLAALSAVVLKAESIADKVEWINKMNNIIQAKGGQMISSENGPTMRHSFSDGSLVSCCSIVIVHVCCQWAFRLLIKRGSICFLVFYKDTMARRPADPEEELRWMSQEVRGYVEAVLNSLAANVPKVSFCF